MANFKGTKGKWSITDGLPNGQDIEAFRIQSNEWEWDIAAVWNDIPSEEAKANALLISKAPEMLEMIQILIGDIERGPKKFTIAEKVEMARKLIKEATEL
jgi:hypothetical protein